MGLLEKKLSSAQIIILGFAAVILLGSFLLMLPISTQDGQGSTFTDALFTATSAVCVTGLVSVDTFTHWSTFGQVVIMLLVQIGGLGVMTIMTIFSLFIKRQLTLQERRLCSIFTRKTTPQAVHRKPATSGTILTD